MRAVPALRLGLLASVTLLSGCGLVHSARMWAPAAAGLDEVHARLFVEPAMTAAQRDDLQREITRGRDRVAAFFGESLAQPYVVACLSDACDQRFGSYGQRAAAYGDIAIRLSGRALTAPLIAHEWAHAELFRRAGGLGPARGIPRWFDEGVAVVVADEPRHSEDNWREIQRRGLAVPRLEALVTFAQWGEAVQPYGETAGDGPDNLHVVYTMAGHEVRRFLGCAGPAGVRAVLAGVRDGQPFEQVYIAAQSRCGP